MLEQTWQEVPAWQARVALDLHYLDNQVDVSVFIDRLPEGQSLTQAADELRDACRELGWIGRLRVWQGPGKG